MLVVIVVVMFSSFWFSQLVKTSAFSSISGILESGRGLFENRVLARIPSCVLPFVFEFGKFPTVVNGSKDFPHEDQDQSNGHNGTNNTQDNTHNVYHHWAFFGLLNPDLKLASLVMIPIDKGGSAFVVIDERTQPFVSLDHFFGLFHWYNFKVAGDLVTLGLTVFIDLVHEGA